MAVIITKNDVIRPFYPPDYSGMRTNRVFIDAEIECGQPLMLPSFQSHHLCTVLRMQAGQFVHLFNGSGGCYRGEISSIGRREVSVLPLEFIPDGPEAQFRINLAQGISRGRHMDYTIQKAVELGVAGIIPLLTEHSNVSLSPGRQDKKLSHWRGVIISACEQCGRNTLPVLEDPADFNDWINKPDDSLRILLDPHGSATISSILPQPVSVTIVAGPEGGFSAREIESALGNSCLPVKLGPRVLRTETAALAAISACQALWGDMR